MKRDCCSLPDSRLLSDRVCVCYEMKRLFIPLQFLDKPIFRRVEVPRKEGSSVESSSKGQDYGRAKATFILDETRRKFLRRVFTGNAEINNTSSSFDKKVYK